MYGKPKQRNRLFGIVDSIPFLIHLTSPLTELTPMTIQSISSDVRGYVVAVCPLGVTFYLRGIQTSS